MILIMKDGNAIRLSTARVLSTSEENFLMLCLRAAADQFKADATRCELANDKRIAHAFRRQAEQAHAMHDNIERIANGEVLSHSQGIDRAA